MKFHWKIYDMYIWYIIYIYVLLNTEHGSIFHNNNFWFHWLANFSELYKEYLEKIQRYIWKGDVNKIQ